jgi:UDPglucose 6-dehydrogenase
LKILKKLGKDTGYETALIDGVLTVNLRQNRLVVRKLRKIFGQLKGLTIGVLGLTYKAGTSTLRRSAALDIIKDLNNEGATVRAYDPKASSEEVQKHKGFIFLDDPYKLAEGADALVVVTDWPEFNDLNFDLIKTKMHRQVIIDAKNMLNNQLLIEKGFTYSGVGRGSKL